MSFDLLVFDLSSAPKGTEDCIKWISDKRRDAELRSTLQGPFNERFKSFYDDIIEHFPDLNGPKERYPIDHELLAFYEFQHDYILMSFRWSKAQNAADTLILLAAVHDLGFYDMNQLIVYPDY